MYIQQEKSIFFGKEIFKNEREAKRQQKRKNKLVELLKNYLQFIEGNNHLH